MQLKLNFENDICLCNDCKQELTDANWYPKYKQQGRYRCKYCHKKHNDKSNARRMYVDSKHVSLKHPKHIPGRWPDWDSVEEYLRTKKKVDIKQAKKRKLAGLVYGITHPRDPGMIKIGKTEDIEKRLSNLNTGCSQRAYKVEFTKWFANCHEAEKAIQDIACLASSKPVTKEENGEWYALSVKTAVEIIRNYEEVRT